MVNILQHAILYPYFYSYILKGGYNVESVIAAEGREIASFRERNREEGRAFAGVWHRQQKRGQQVTAKATTALLLLLPLLRLRWWWWRLLLRLRLLMLLRLRLLMLLLRRLRLPMLLPLGPLLLPLNCGCCCCHLPPLLLLLRRRLLPRLRVVLRLHAALLLLCRRAIRHGRCHTALTGCR